MNYYERIHQAIQYIEDHLENQIDLNEIASKAYMSLSSFYRMFFALTGHSVKEYIRKRRIARAASDIVSGQASLITIAFKYGFDSSDTFSRAFKQIVGCSPSSYRKQDQPYRFERIDVLVKYYDVQDQELLEKYPEIRVLKKVNPMRVASYTYIGRNPEYHAFKVLLEWAHQNQITPNDHKYRVFGYDTPDSPPGSDVYGYEACITIDDDLIVDDSRVKAKELTGGSYAVTTVAVKDIPKAWKRFKSWVKMSKYQFGTHQWLEEHLDGVHEDFDYEVELYMPICEKNDKYSYEVLEDMNVMMCKVIGEEDTAPFEAWDTLLKWAAANGITESTAEHRFFAHHNYNTGRQGIKKWYAVMVTVKANDDVIPKAKSLKRDVIGGGSFFTCGTDFGNLPETWTEMVSWIGFSGEQIDPKVKWREEWQVQDGKLFPENSSNIKVYAPIKRL